MPTPNPPRRRIVVDGSNIATEGRTLPSLAQLDEAIRTFLVEFPGFTTSDVTVVVDASFAHRIDPSEVPAFEEAVLHGEMVTPPAGAVGRGDGFILRIAEKSGALVLSNDSFQEFHAERPWLFDDGRLIGGKPVPGIGWVFTPRTPVRGPKSRAVTSQSRRDARAASGADAAAAGSAPDEAGAGTDGSLESDSTSRPSRAAKSTKATKAAKPTKAAKSTKAAKAEAESDKGSKDDGAKSAKGAKAAKGEKAAAKGTKAAKGEKAAKESKPAKSAKGEKAAKASGKAAKRSAGATDSPHHDPGDSADQGAAAGPGGTTRPGRGGRSTGATKATKAPAAAPSTRRAAPEAPALNEPLVFLTFVADHPVGSTLEGIVASFTSHGAHIDVGDMRCHVPLQGLGNPPPIKARDVVTKGETREFVLVSLDPARRRAELALPGVAG
jgi:hypothetical protein